MLVIKPLGLFLFRIYCTLNCNYIPQIINYMQWALTFTSNIISIRVAIEGTYLCYGPTQMFLAFASSSCWSFSLLYFGFAFYILCISLCLDKFFIWHKVFISKSGISLVWGCSIQSWNIYKEGFGFFQCPLSWFVSLIARLMLFECIPVGNYRMSFVRSKIRIINPTLEFLPQARHRVGLSIHVWFIRYLR